MGLIRNTVCHKDALDDCEDSEAACQYGAGLGAFPNRPYLELKRGKYHRDVRFQEGIELTGLGESEYGEASAALNDRPRQEWRPA
jgi:hypothetical protein